MSGRESLRPSPFGAITDVDGITVGHDTRASSTWRTGTTVVVAPDGAVGAVAVAGGGPGTRETDALSPQRLVDRIHAVCLSGGSAFGLATADGVALELERAGLGFAVPGGIVPVVPAAVIFDLGRGGDFSHRPDAESGRRAAQRALRGRARTATPTGAVGAGTGAIAGGLQGGIGTASIDVGDSVVGALVVVNSSGSSIDPATGELWEAGLAGVGSPSATESRRLRRHLADRLEPRLPMNTTIGVIATSADLSRAEASMVAAVGHDGIARAIRPAHSMFDGDTLFCLATGTTGLGETTPAAYGDRTSRPGALNSLLGAAADCVALACMSAVLGARSHRSSTRVPAPPAYADLAPGVVRHLFR